MIMLWVISFVYPASPDYESVSGYYSTGAGVSYVDGDSIPDIVITNGNDMEAEENHIYFGQGTLPDVNPYVFSSLLNYSGHLALGDVNGDGHEDLIIANYGEFVIGNPEVDPELVHLWENNSFESTPSWVSPYETWCFAVDVADVNGDGFIDAVFGCSPDPQRLFLSTGYTLDTVPVWQADSSYSYGLAFLDVDLDGDMDLFIGNSEGPHKLYLNLGGYMDTMPAWMSDSIGDANQIFVEDVDGNGYPDVIVTNTFVSYVSRRRVEIYFNHNGMLETTPSWVYYASDYFSTAAAGDIDGDGDVDLVVGGWWSPIRIFKNRSGVLDTIPSWEWSPSSQNGLVAERIFLFDIDGAGLVDAVDTFIYNSGNAFWLNHRPVHGNPVVYLNGSRLLPPDWSFHREKGYVFINSSLLNPGDTVVVEYQYSTSLDLFVSNWEESRGNFLFLNTSTGSREVVQGGGIRYKDGYIYLNMPLRGGYVEIYDIGGRVVERGRVDGEGRMRVNLSKGVYVVRVDGRAFKVVVW